MTYVNYSSKKIPLCYYHLLWVHNISVAPSFFVTNHGWASNPNFENHYSIIGTYIQLLFFGSFFEKNNNQPTMIVYQIANVGHVFDLKNNHQFLFFQLFQNQKTYGFSFCKMKIETSFYSGHF